MQKIMAIIAVACLIQAGFSTCPDGTFTTPAGSDLANHGTCTTCPPFCLTCSGWMKCITYISRMKGYDPTTGNYLCPNAYTYGNYGSGQGVGYDSVTDTCRNCLDGCSTCSVDYDYCYQC